MSTDAIQTLMQHTEPAGRTPAETLLAIPTRVLSSAKFALIDAPNPSAGLPGLCNRLTELKNAALDECPELLEDEAIGWIDDVLKAAGAPEPSADDAAALFRDLATALQLPAQARAARFAKGAALDLKPLYRQFVQIQKTALADGVLGEDATTALRGLQDALGHSPSSDEVHLYVSGYVEGLVEFLVDEGLLAP